MGTIVARPRQNGTTAYMAKIILKREGKTVHRETKTFDRRAAAAGWIARREEELSKPGAIEKARTCNETLADAIDKFTQESVRYVGRSKTQMLRTIKTYPIASLPCDQIDSAEIVKFAKELAAGDRVPQTISGYLSSLASIFAIATPAWNIPLDRQAMKDAFVVANRLGIAGKSKARDRRPTLEEIDQLMAYFVQSSEKRYNSQPMHIIVAFAIFSTRRQGEIARITWADLDEEHSRIMVRDMKHPGDKEGNDTWCDLPEQALKIIQAAPRTDDRIFPFSEKSISTSFTRACEALEINTEETPEAKRLHFHDLRHDGVSRLFEIGFNIPHAAAVSGHRSWASLKRYTHVRQRGDKYAGWKWLPIVTRQQPQHTPQPGPCSAET